MYKTAPHKPNHSIEPTKPKLSLLVPLSTLCLISLSNKANNHQQQQPSSKKTRTKTMASISKRFFSFLFVIIFSLLGFVGFSQGRKLSGLSDQEGTGGGSGASMQCVQKLIPCQPFLKAPEKAPAACCLPLKQMVSDDTKCLCSVFNNPGMLSNLNITQDDALKLPKACGANADISICGKGNRAFFLSFFAFQNETKSFRFCVWSYVSMERKAIIFIWSSDITIRFSIEKLSYLLGS